MTAPWIDDPKPGLYPRDAFDYALINAVNFSTLKAIAVSPLHYAHALHAESPSTVPMRLGAVAHCMVLEPEHFVKRYAVWDPPGKKPDFRGKDYETYRDAAEAQGLEVIKPKERDEGARIATAIRGSRAAQRYMRAIDVEQIVIWRDKLTGILCKGRIDAISRSVADVFVEIKTARQVDPWAFSGAFARLMYHVQTAWYARGLEAATGRPWGAKCIAVENHEPNDVVVFDLAEVRDAGSETADEWLATLAKHRESNEWPGQVPDAEVTMNLPKWMDPEYDRDLSDLELEGVAPELDA